MPRPYELTPAEEEICVTLGRLHQLVQNLGGRVRHLEDHRIEVVTAVDELWQGLHVSGTGIALILDREGNA